MARHLRIQYSGALYHVFNRGNYRRPVFGTAGAASSFLDALDEACGRFRWRIHAYAIMRNHYHLALETPEANLGDGMHWLQVTFAVRFNRFRREQGHLFQGRYHALLVEDNHALFRVANYIDLNPVRAGIVPPEAAASFRWGSLARIATNRRPSWLAVEVILTALGVEDNASGWSRYREYLVELSRNATRQKQLGFDQISVGWAIGTNAWRQAVAEDLCRLKLYPGEPDSALDVLRKARWHAELELILRQRGLKLSGLHELTDALDLKIAVAAEIRQRAAAPYRWIADALCLPSQQSLRMQVHRHRLHTAT